MTIGFMIRGLRMTKGMSARELSQAIEKSPSYVTKLETGEIEPSFRSFAKIARVFRLTPGELDFIVRHEAAR